jgi:quercetin dioxygenase-like cupin family protein
MEVIFKPDGSSPPHKHGGANVFALVIEGEILSGMNDGEAKVYKRGETWYEAPGCLHRVSDNNSKTQPARLIATFVIKTEVLEREGPSVLVQVEPEYLSQLSPDAFNQID